MNIFILTHLESKVILKNTKKIVLRFKFYILTENYKLINI